MKGSRISRPVKACFSLVLTTVALLYPAANAQEAKVNQQILCSSIPVISRTSDGKLISTNWEWAQFQALRRDWTSQRGASSSLTDTSMLEPYQRIIAMGRTAVPLILAQLRAEGSEPDQWFWALRVITGANPVKPEDQGDFRAMATAWIAWGTEQELAEYAG